MAQITEIRRALQAAVEPLLTDDEDCSVAAAPSEFEKGLAKLHFAVTVAVGPAGDEAAERLDELLSGAVKEALELCEVANQRPTVIKTSGYQQVADPAKKESRLGATWTAQLLE